MAILTVHHWSDRQAGYAELCRVSRHRVVLIIGATYVETVPIPHDCTDRFTAAYWQRPTRLP